MSTELWSDMAPDLWPAFWTTIKLTFWSALGSMILGTILTAMRVSPVGILRTIATFYINTTRNTPLTLIVLFASLGLYVNLNVTLAPQGPTFTTENNFRLAVLAFILYTSSFVAGSLRAGIHPSE